MTRYIIRNTGFILYLALVYKATDVSLGHTSLDLENLDLNDVIAR